MQTQKIIQELSEFIDSLEIINTHSHHLPDVEHKSLDLNTILKNSYIYWCGFDIPKNKAQRREYVRALRHNTYFLWLEKSLQELYGISTPLDETSWDLYDKAIKKSHEKATYHMDILTEKCNYKYIVTDPYWHPGNAQGHKDYFTPTFRINMFLFGYSPTALENDGNNPFISYRLDNNISFDEYIIEMTKIIKMKKANGCVALKSAIAYDRGLDFKEVSKESAQKAYMNPDATPEDIKNFQDYIFFEICRIAAKLNLPFQNHTGLGCLKNTNAIQMEEVISKNPDTKFSIMHGSYPWVDDMCALIHAHSNVYADICWLPIISTSKCETLLRELIEIGDINRITWGCDTLTSEESYGALLAMRQVLLNVFTKCITDKFMTFNQAKEYISHIMYKNAKQIYKLKSRPPA